MSVKKIKVTTINAFFDKKQQIKRSVGEEFELTPARIKEIQKYEKAHNIVLIKIIDSEVD